MKTLILITGDLATGKSTLAKRLSQKIKALCFTKDVLKEILSDDIGFSCRQENKNLSIASVDIMKHIFCQYAFLEQDLILEANFHKPEIIALKTLAKQLNYKIFLFFLQGETNQLFQKFTSRIKEQGRHPTHCTDDIIEPVGFEKYLLANRKELSQFLQEKQNPDFSVTTIKVKDDNYDSVFSQVLKAIHFNFPNTKEFKA